MLTHPTLDHLAAMGLHGMAKAFAELKRKRAAHHDSAALTALLEETGCDAFLASAPMDSAGADEDDGEDEGADEGPEGPAGTTCQAGTTDDDGGDREAEGSRGVSIKEHPERECQQPRTHGNDDEDGVEHEISADEAEDYEIVEVEESGDIRRWVWNAVLCGGGGV
mgnify:CR=1 FL=1